MNITSIASYMNGFQLLKTYYSGQYHEIIDNISKFNTDNYFQKISDDRYVTNAREVINWDERLLKLGWDEFPVGESRYNSLDLIKDGVSVNFHRSYKAEKMVQVLYDALPYAMNNLGMKLSVFIYFRDETYIDYLINTSGYDKAINYCFEREPLDVKIPFVIIGISDKKTLSDISLYEIKHEISDVSEHMDNESKIVRTIEFEPEHLQAGMGIISYFNKILHENYRNNIDKVSIVQENLVVKMIVLTKLGDKEIIERALDEYSQVLNGVIQPEEYFHSSMKVLELKTELKIANMRLELQKELDNERNIRIDKLLNTIGEGFKQPYENIINVTPVIHINNVITQNTTIQNEFGELLQVIKQLKNVSLDPEVTDDIIDIEKEISNGDDVQTKATSILTKLKNFLDKINQANAVGEKFFDTLEKSSELIKKVASIYNKISDLIGF